MKNLTPVQAKKFVEGYNAAVSTWNETKSLPAKTPFTDCAKNGYDCVRSWVIHMIINNNAPADMTDLYAISESDVQDVRWEQRARLQAILESGKSKTFVEDVMRDLKLL